MSVIIKEYQPIIAALIIAASIYIFANKNTYDYVTMGDTGVIIFKNGEIDLFCELTLDSCYYKNDINQYSQIPMNLRDLLEERVREDREWRSREQEILKERLK